jgi:hypothetical protein
MKYAVEMRSGAMIYIPSFIKTRVEAGSNTSTVNLRVVGGDEMGQKRAAP